MTRAGLIAAGVPMPEIDLIGAELLAAKTMFAGPLGAVLEERAMKAVKMDLPANPRLLDAAAVTVRIARELAQERGLPWPKREDFKR